MKRTIFHCDMNNYYATVETKLDPSLKDKAIAVCGSVKERHGIVLAKSYQAKAKGVRTGEAIYEAKAKCPELIVITPHFEEYVKYSRKAREIYCSYTDRIESFGIDECWLDMTGTEGLFGKAEEAASMIKGEIKEKLGLTISVGISFNKIFAKLASDIADRDDIFIIGDDFKETVGPLSVNSLLGIGYATRKKLARYGIHTISDLAETRREFLGRLLGKNGIVLHFYANGLDTSPVRSHLESAPVKSVGHGITLVRDVKSSEEVYLVLLELALDVAYRLAGLNLMAYGVELTIRDSTLAYFQYQTSLKVGTASPGILASEALELLKERYKWNFGVRSVSIRAICLREYTGRLQLDILGNYIMKEKKEQIAKTIVEIRTRYGRSSITYGSLLGDVGMPEGRTLELVMPGAIKR